ncbi:sensor histidine kinase [Corynebacterium antarcticum]|uniref:sensor histidine kinase n=1 Tax=Corynebacterium antarcticum TaxID=2800405 RepID=UPI002260987E|nr:histidine kinase [Corynebacterium antarcticum]MCX7539810.1 histidine kinase [Corynebacterium antarcticum]
MTDTNPGPHHAHTTVPVTRTDVLVAAVATTIGLAGVVMASQSAALGIPLTVPSAGLGTLVALSFAGQGIVLLFRRRRPVGVLWACGALDIAVGVLFAMLEPDAARANSVALPVALYTLFRERDLDRRSLINGSAAFLITLTVRIITAPPVPGGAALTAVSVAGAVVTGTLVAVSAYILRRRDMYTEILRERAELTDSRRAALAEAAAAEERTRIARELHDTTAHHLSAIAVQATAARAVIDTDPVAAAAILRRISSSASAALDDVRETVGHLRANGGGQDGAGDLPGGTGDLTAAALIDAGRRAGTDITATLVSDELLPSGAARRAIHRVLQEALTNARRHAPGCAVTVEMTERRLSVRTWGHFVDAPPGTGSIGMSERAAAIGARLRNDRDADGWIVELDWGRCRDQGRHRR